MMAQIGFWILAILAVGSALGTVLHRNPFRAALFLVVNFTVLAVVYVMLNAQVLAVLQVLVYAGAIMVLVLFVIQLLNLGGETAPTDPLAGQRFFGFLFALLLLTALVYGVNYAARQAPIAGASLDRIRLAESQGISQIQIIGWDLFTRYVYPFELTSILLLVGAMGAITLIRRRALEAATSEATRNHGGNP